MGVGRGGVGGGVGWGTVGWPSPKVLRLLLKNRPTLEQ